MSVTNFDALATRVVTGITALAGGGQSGATLLAFGSSGGSGQCGAFRVDTVATAADSVRLPPTDGSPFSVPVGTEIAVVNNGANSMQVFGSGTDTINGVATGTGVAQAAGKSAIYKLYAAGAWFRLLSA